jgi:hypothetical protein
MRHATSCAVNFYNADVVVGESVFTSAKKIYLILKMRHAN